MSGILGGSRFKPEFFVGGGSLDFGAERPPDEPGAATLLARGESVGSHQRDTILAGGQDMAKKKMWMRYTVVIELTAAGADAFADSLTALTEVYQPGGAHISGEIDHLPSEEDPGEDTPRYVNLIAPLNAAIRTRDAEMVSALTPLLQIVMEGRLLK